MKLITRGFGDRHSIITRGFDIVGIIIRNKRIWLESFITRTISLISYKR